MRSLFIALRWIFRHPWKAAGAFLVFLIAYTAVAEFDSGGPTFSAPGRCQMSEHIAAENRFVGTQVSMRRSSSCWSDYGEFVTIDAPEGEVELILSEGRLTGWLYLQDVR